MMVGMTTAKTEGDSGASEIDHARADMGLVCALAMELDPFFERCTQVRAIKGNGMRFRGGRLGKLRVAAVEGGAGVARARRATQALIDGHRPDWVLSVGFAGGLVAGLNIGDVVVADEVVSDEAEATPVAVAHGMPADPAKGLHVGRIVTCDRIIRTVEEKQRLARDWGAIACEMETHAVAAVCQAAGVRFMSVRAITDDLSADLPTEVHSLLSANTGARRAGAALGALWKRPESIKELWALQGTAHKAASRLAPFLESVLVQLG